jgi:hypothetical protein
MAVNDYNVVHTTTPQSPKATSYSSIIIFIKLSPVVSHNEEQNSVLGQRPQCRAMPMPTITAHGQPELILIHPLATFDPAATQSL